MDVQADELCQPGIVSLPWRPERRDDQPPPLRLLPGHRLWDLFGGLAHGCFFRQVFADPSPAQQKAEEVAQVMVD